MIHSGETAAAEPQHGRRMIFTGRRCIECGIIV